MDSMKKRKAQFMRILILSLGLLFIVCGAGYGEEKPSYLLKKNVLGFKLGYHFFESSEFTDFWGINEEDLDGFTFELAYERKITTTLGIELSLGYFESEETYHDVAFRGDSSKIKFKNYYLSPSLKYYIPVTKTFLFYLGGGPDLYYARGDYRYKISGFPSSYHASYNFITFGLHGLAGIEWYFIRYPAKSGLHDIPVSLVFEYKYSWVEIKDADEEAINDLNSVGLNLSKNDLDVGGHMAFIGLRWHF
jgi:opacity protein-like surface antigen